MTQKKRQKKQKTDHLQTRGAGQLRNAAYAMPGAVGRGVHKGDKRGDRQRRRRLAGTNLDYDATGPSARPWCPAFALDRNSRAGHVPAAMLPCVAGGAAPHT